jgi:hypothetical protein
MDVVTKEAIASITAVEESTHPNGEFDLILSTDDLDRDGENLWVDEWKTLPDHLHGDTDHAFQKGAGVEKTAGSGVPRIENNQLRVRGTYAGTEHGQLTRQLVNEGHIRTASVAYTERKDKKSGKVERELLNFTFTGVPANPNAKILSSKAAKTSGSPAGDSPTDTPPGESDQDDDEEMPPHDDLVQAVHDASVHLGADCLEEDDTGEADGANKSVGLLAAILKHVMTPAEIKALVDKSSGSKSVGSPPESADGSAAAAVTKTAAAADESADDAARARARAYLHSKSMERILDET